MRFDGISILMEKLRECGEKRNYGQVTVFISPENSYSGYFQRSTSFANLPDDVKVAAKTLALYFNSPKIEISCDDKKPRNIKRIINFEYEF
jgi:hypothetical protein